MLETPELQTINLKLNEQALPCTHTCLLAYIRTYLANTARICVCMSVRPSVCLFVYLSACLSVGLPVIMSVCVYVCI